MALCAIPAKAFSFIFSFKGCVHLISSACICAQFQSPNGDLECSPENLSALGFTFRIPHAWKTDILASERVCIHFYPAEGPVSVHLTVSDFSVLSEEEDRYSCLMRMETDCTDYRNAAIRLMHEVNAYTQIKLSLEPSELSEKLTGYPAKEEKVFPTSFHEQMEAWIADLQIDDQWQTIHQDVAISLTTPSLLTNYLNSPAGSLPAPYSDFHHPLMCRVRVVYFGSSICPYLLPCAELLVQAIHKAQNEHLKPVLVLPPLTPSEYDKVTDLLKTVFLHVTPHPEVSLNDWGLIRFIHELDPDAAIELGPLLHRTTRDVRMPFLAPFPSETSLHADFFLDALHAWGINRGSAQCIEHPFRPLPIPFSLHLPFFQMNTSLNCTLRSAALYGSRGYQPSADICTKPCSSHAFLYPTFLHMTGRYNSLFGYDQKCLSASRYLRSLMGTTCDRLVLHLFEEVQDP